MTAQPPPGSAQSSDLDPIRTQSGSHGPRSHSTTGDDDVDAVIAPLSGLDDAPLADHRGLYADIYDRLAEVLDRDFGDQPGRDEVTSASTGERPRTDGAATMG